MQAFDDDRGAATGEEKREQAESAEERDEKAETGKQPWLPPIAPVRPNVKKKSAEEKQNALCGLLTPGTAACGLLCGTLFVGLAALLLWIGFLKTLFIAAAGAVGVFVGAVENKSDWVKNLINKLFPPRN